MQILLIMFFIVFTSLSANMTDVSLALSWKNQFQFAGYFVAKEKGFYKDVGLNVDIVEYDLQRDISEEVATLKYDFGVGHSSLILDKLNRFSNIRMLSAINQSSPLILLAKKRPDIRTIADIAGKKIMMGNNQTYIASINAMLSSATLQQNSFEVIPTSFNPIDLINGNADLMISYLSNESFILKEKGIDYTIFDPKEYGYDFYSDILFTSTQMIQKDPKIVDAFYKATMKGWRYAYGNIQESAEIIVDKYNTQNRSIKALLFEAETLKKFAFKEGVNFGDINPLKLKEIATTYRLLGLITTKKKIDFKDFIYSNLDVQRFTPTKIEQEYLLKKEQIKICINVNDRPFQGIEKGEYIGVSSDFISKIQKNVNTNFEFINTNNMDESIAFLKEKKCDIIPVSKGDINRDKNLSISTPYIEIPLVMATHKDSLYSFDLSDVKDKPIGIIENQLNPNDFLDISIVKQTTPKQALENIASKNIFGFIGDIISVKKAMQVDGIEEIQLMNNINKRLPLSMITRVEDKVLFNILQKSINLIDESTKHSILNKWMGVKYIKSYNYELFQMMVGIVFIILILAFYMKYRMNTLLKIKAKALNTQLEIFHENISAARTDAKGVITYVSELFCKQSGYTEKELIGKTHAILRDKDTADSLYHDLWMTINSGHTWRGEIKNRKKNGSEYWVHVVISPTIDKNKKIIGFSTLLEDITLEKVLQNYNKKLELEVKQRTKELETLAITDKLTDMYNRVKLDDMLNFYMANYKRYNHTFSLMIVDIDNFKKINDTYGHLQGDEVLKSLSLILKSVIRSVDTLGRWGGEEFMIICPNNDIDGAIKLAKKICNLIESSSFSINQKVTVSIGVAEISASMDENDLINKADTALYKAKERGRNRVVGS